jgi:hypothetical protein
MFKKFVIALALLTPVGFIAFVGFNSSTIDPVCHVLVNCQFFKQPYDTAVILNRDAKAGLINSRNIDDLQRVYELAEKSSNAIGSAKIPSKYLNTSSLNNSNKELLDKARDRINQEEIAKIYLKQAQYKAAEADILATAYLARINQKLQRQNDEHAAFLAKLKRESIEFDIKQANENTGNNNIYRPPTAYEILNGGKTYVRPQPEKEVSEWEEKKQQRIEYTEALSLYKESLKLVESIHPNSFVDNEKTLLLKTYSSKVASTQNFINTYLGQFKK